MMYSSRKVKVFIYNETGSVNAKTESRSPLPDVRLVGRFVVLITMIVASCCHGEENQG